MRTCICMYNGVVDEQLQDLRAFRYTFGGTVLIHGFLFSHGGDD
jgi:hypothetical protein